LNEELGIMNNLNLLRKIIFFWKKPKIIIITGNGQEATAGILFCLLSQNFKVAKFKEKAPDILSICKKEILIFESDLKKIRTAKDFKFLVKKSQLPILVITQFGDIPPAALSDEPKGRASPNEVGRAAPSGEPQPQKGQDKDFFAGDKKDTIQSRELAKILPAYGYLILNFDDETVREIGEETDLKGITFGFQEGADLRASDIRLNSGTNFKINYKGNIVPIWLEKAFGKELIYSALGAAAVGTVLGFNLVEISSSLKNYNSP